MNAVPADRGTAHDVVPYLPQGSAFGGMDSSVSSIRPADPHLRAVATRRVAVVGPTTIVVEALAVALDVQPDIEAVATATSLTGALQLVDQHRPEVVIVHVPQPGVEAIEAVGGFRAVTPQVKVVLLVGWPDYELLARAAEMGVAACLSLDTGLHGLISVIRSETAGAMVVAASFLPTALAAGPDRMLGRQLCGLTARELQVLALLAEGYGQQAIASHLVISVYTARGHVKNVLRKLGAHSQLEAIALAARMGLLRRSGGGWGQRCETSAEPLTGAFDG
jgi:DNA-binding NarL/FixJ family response regulator